MDLMASSAVNLPITSASLRLNVILTGVRSIRCTYSAAWVPPFYFHNKFRVCHSLSRLLSFFITGHGRYSFRIPNDHPR
jgi:hypothetical protein